ncbi:MAG TPA: patatin-like phospholipase family protein, partial [Rugosimonospora sp.]|nr:patatin-like phospholipase family protein [Rugosimonospora sp.]
MPRTGRPRHRRERFGVVLGGGGVLGAAWMAGALGALEEFIGRPFQDAEIILGTSAGSVLAASLRCGVTVDTIVAHQRGVVMAPIPLLSELDRDSGARPPLPRLRLGSPRLLASTARAPHRMHP